jgi:hypothetical protein
MLVCPPRTTPNCALVWNQYLTHLVGVNGLFTALIGESRSRPGCRLVEWTSERPSIE